MRLNELHPATGSRKATRRVGRGIGSGIGKTGGRGMKGQKSRTGGSVKPGFEGGQMPLQRRVPKFGFNSRLAANTVGVRLSELKAVEGDEVTLQSLKAANIIGENFKFAKVFLQGEIDRAFTVKGVKVTKGAREAIEKAGGKVED